jgi:hypothetical protein
MSFYWTVYNWNVNLFVLGIIIFSKFMYIFSSHAHSYVSNISRPLFIIISCTSNKREDKRRKKSSYLPKFDSRIMKFNELVYSTGFWQWCITFRITGGFKLFPSSGILGTTTDPVSEKSCFLVPRIPDKVWMTCHIAKLISHTEGPKKCDWIPPQKRIHILI